MTCYTLKNTIQIDGITRQVRVFTDFITGQQAATLFQLTNGHALYEHKNGEMSQVRICPAGIGLCKIWLANLPSEIPAETIKKAMEKCGIIYDIREELRSLLYR